MASPYNGQPFNLGIFPEVASPFDVRLVQGTETDLKTPSTWLRGGIYCIGQGMLFSTTDGKVFQYTGRSGNATDIADDTKWKRILSREEVLTLMSELTNPFQYQGNINGVPQTSSPGYVYRAQTNFTLPAANNASGESESVTAGDLLICVSSGVFSVIQGNLEGAVTAPNVSDRNGYIPFFTSPNGTTLGATDVTSDDLVMLIKEFKGIQQTTLPSNPAVGSLCQMIRIFRQNGNSLASEFTLEAATPEALGGIKTGFTEAEGTKRYAVQLDENDNAFVEVPWTDTQSEVATESAAGLITAGEKKYLNATTAEIPTANENTFIAAIVALFPKVGTKSFNVKLGITAGVGNNFFGFAVSAPHVIAQVDVVSSTAFKLHFKNYSRDGLSTSAYVPYTYDSTNKTLYYEEFSETVVS